MLSQGDRIHIAKNFISEFCQVTILLFAACKLCRSFILYFQAKTLCFTSQKWTHFGSSVWSMFFYGRDVEGVKVSVSMCVWG